MARYRLLKRLAKGGMAEVFLAEAVGPEGFKKKLVIKRILPHLAGDDEFVSMFLNEARLAAQLTHPNVAQIFELGQLKESPFLSMEFVDGPNLRTVLGHAARLGRTLDVNVACKIVSLACEGLAYAHELKGDDGPMNLIHRDVSPENIMVARSGAVKVVDFGIAKAENVASRTQAGQIKGKISYMAPEQVRGQPLDLRADLYAICVVLYELLTGGKKPYTRTNLNELMREIAFEQHVPLRQARPDLPPALVAIVEKGLQKDRAQRYADCRELAGELERFLVMRGAWVTPSQLAQAVTGIVAEGEGTKTPPAGQSSKLELDGVVIDGEATFVAQGLDEDPPGEPAEADPEDIDEVDDSQEVLATEVRAGEKPKSLAAELFGTETNVSAVTDPGPRRPEVTPLVDDPFAGAKDATDVADLDHLPTAARMTATAAPHEQTVTVPGVDGAAPPPAKSKTALLVAIPAVLILAGVGFVALRPAAEPAASAGAEPAAPVESVEVERPVAAPKPAEPQPKPAEPPSPGPAAAAVLTLLRVESDPSCEVTVGGKAWGKTPVDIKGLPAGAQQVKLESAEHHLVRELSVDVRPNEITVSSTRFGQGKLTVRAKPFARVTVDGKSYGVTPLPPLPLYEGSHQVELLYDGGAKPVKRVKAVTIKDRGEAKVVEVFQ